MNTLLEDLLVALIVLSAALVALRSLLPFSWRVRLARLIQGRVPDRVLLWLAGQQGCDACDRKPPTDAPR